MIDETERITLTPQARADCVVGAWEARENFYLADSPNHRPLRSHLVEMVAADVDAAMKVALADAAPELARAGLYADLAASVEVLLESATVIVATRDQTEEIILEDAAQVAGIRALLEQIKNEGGRGTPALQGAAR